MSSPETRTEELTIPEGRALNGSLVKTLQKQGVEILVDDARRKIIVTWRDQAGEQTVESLRVQLGLSEKIPPVYKAVTISNLPGDDKNLRGDIQDGIIFSGTSAAVELSGETSDMRIILADPTDGSAYITKLLKKISAEVPQVKFTFEQ